MLEYVFSFKRWCCCIVTKYICLLQISTVLCAEHCNRNQWGKVRFGLSLRKVCWEKLVNEVLTYGLGGPELSFV